MKKFLALLLCLVMLAGMGSAAVADDSQTEAYKANGVTITYPAEIGELRGLFTPYPLGKLSDALCLLDFFYIAMDEETYMGYMEMDEEELNAHPEAIEAVRNAQFMAGLLITAKEGADPEMLYGEPGISWTEVGRADGYVWYYADRSTSGDAGAFDAEFKALGAKLGEILKTAEYYAPVVFGSDMVGKSYSFEAVDTEGNAVSSEEIFSQHAFTMVNCWATWCGPCVGELEELAAMNKALQDKDCAIIGIMMDGDDPDAAETGRAIMAENGVDYTVLLMNDQLEEIFALEHYPTSFFFDRSGKVACEPLEGAFPEVYEGIFGSLLDGGEVSFGPADATSAAVENDMKAYRVLVTDTDGKPVEGVKVQFCDDATCTVHKTDADGIAVFDADEGSYTIHIIKVPEGFEKYNDEVKTLNTYSDVYIFLQKAA